MQYGQNNQGLQFSILSDKTYFSNLFENILFDILKRLNHYETWTKSVSDLMSLWHRVNCFQSAGSLFMTPSEHGQLSQSTVSVLFSNFDKSHCTELATSPSVIQISKNSKIFGSFDALSFLKLWAWFGVMTVACFYIPLDLKHWNTSKSSIFTCSTEFMNETNPSNSHSYWTRSQISIPNGAVAK